MIESSAVPTRTVAAALLRPRDASLDRPGNGDTAWLKNAREIVSDPFQRSSRIYCTDFLLTVGGAYSSSRSQECSGAVHCGLRTWTSGRQPRGA